MPFLDSKKIPSFSKSIDSAKQSVGGAVKKLIPDAVPSGGQAVSSATQTNPTTYTAPKAFSGDYASKQNELFGNLESTMKTPFQYNPETDPAYQAQRQLAQLRAKDANRATMETMNDRGLLQSTMTNSQLDQNAQRAEQEALAYIPQFRDQAYGQYQDRIKNAGDLLTTARALRGDQFNEAVTEAGLTGNYLSDKDRTAQPLLKNLVTYGQEFGSATPERQAELRKLANDTRAQLSQMGVDPSLFDSKLSTEQRQAALGKIGTRTLQGQQQDYAQQADQRDFDFQKAQQEWSNNFNQAQFDWNKAQTLWENAFQGRKFEQDMKDAAASRGLQWASLNQRDKEFIADQEFRKKQFKYQQDQDLINNRDKGAALSDKQSTDNYNTVMDDITSGATKAEARALLQQNSPYLNDSDYKKINDYINDNL